MVTRLVVHLSLRKTQSWRILPAAIRRQSTPRWREHASLPPTKKCGGGGGKNFSYNEYGGGTPAPLLLQKAHVHFTIKRSLPM
jgi:hypothetical protein